MAARRRIPGIPQTAGQHPCGGLLGTCEAKIWRGVANAAQGDAEGRSGSDWRMLLLPTFQAGAGVCRADTGGAIWKAAGAGKACFRRVVVMGKWDAGENRAEICVGQGHSLPAGAVAVPGKVSGGWPSGAEQQPCRAQH
jgi:hypothetical protein